MSIIINDTVEEYIKNLYDSKNEFMKKLRKKSEENSIPIITKDTEKFMDILIQMNRPKNILELGTAVAYSSIGYCLIDPDVMVTTIEISDFMYDQAIENIEEAKMTDRIKILKGDAKEVVDNIDEKFDMIFIDAAKAQYKKYFDSCVKNLNEGGIIVSDNILYKGMPVAREFVVKRQRTIASRMKTYNEYITHHEEFNSTILTVGDGIGISIRKVKN